MSNIESEIENLKTGSVSIFEFVKRQEPLIPELEADYVESFEECMGMPCIFNKFVHTVMAVPHYFALYNEQYRFRSQAADKFLINKEFEKYLAVIEKPYRVEEFLKIQPMIEDDQAYYNLFEDIWVCVENIWQYKDQLALHIIERVATLPDHQRFDPAVKLNFDSNGELEIYRGVNKNGDHYGLSFTTDREQARWFSSRLCKSKEGYVRELTVTKDDIIFTTNRRAEKEVVTLLGLNDE